MNFLQFQQSYRNALVDQIGQLNGNTIGSINFQQNMQIVLQGYTVGNYAGVPALTGLNIGFGNNIINVKTRLTGYMADNDKICLRVSLTRDNNEVAINNCVLWRLDQGEYRWRNAENLMEWRSNPIAEQIDSYNFWHAGNEPRVIFNEGYQVSLVNDTRLSIKSNDENINGCPDGISINEAVNNDEQNNHDNILIAVRQQRR